MKVHRLFLYQNPMKVSGFTFIRNGIKFDFPFVEAILSILPICDEMVVAVGNSQDDTLKLVQNIDSPKIRIIETVWDDSLRQGGKVLAAETNKALAAISQDSDWAFYIQGDEVVHEEDLPKIKESMLLYKDDKKVEGLLFDYIHFYGSYRYYGDSRKWYRREIRIIRPGIGVFSFRDAQGFRKYPNQKLKVKPANARIFHYGWVRPPKKQLQKLYHSGHFWNRGGDDSKETLPFEYAKHIDSLSIFDKTHPEVMKKRIEAMNWEFEFDTKIKNYSLKNAILTRIEKMTGIRIGEYKNYKLL